MHQSSAERGRPGTEIGGFPWICRMASGISLGAYLAGVSLWGQTSPPPEPLKTSVTVVGDLTTETPATISVLRREQLEEIPAATLDNRLRNVPGFSLFRRASSLVTHPTTQGVSLRGLGSSGASRTLVLWDGIPLNDPFGGWVYWTRLDPQELDRVEIARGATTSAFGDRTLSGAIALFSRPLEMPRLTGSYIAGNRNTQEVSAGFSESWNRWAASIDARAFTTDGYFIVPAAVRGSIDTPAGVRFVTGNTHLDYTGPRHRLFIKADMLVEDRKNGTVLQTNSTSLGTVSGRYFRESANTTLTGLAYHTREQFHAGFSAVAADRNSERLTSRQTVPATATGGALYMQHRRSQWEAFGGADTQRSAGESIDRLVPTGLRVGGGTIWERGLFGQLQGRFRQALLFVGAREDWTGQGGQFFSPRAGVVAGRGSWRARTSVYRSFRAPTLNELYREFRMGNVVTLANAGLRPETVFGAEVGADWEVKDMRLTVTGYRLALDGLITNVTLTATPSLITRQRQNAAAALARGVEVEVHQRWRHWQGQLGYLYADSRYRTGERIPQSPRHQGSAQLVYQRGGTTASAGLRSYALQFEDDRNQFVLPGFATVQLVIRQRLSASLTALAEAENLLDRQYLVGFSPTPNLGGPRLWRVGLRWEGRWP